jgi:hypothetical protein
MGLQSRAVVLVLLLTSCGEQKVSAPAAPPPSVAQTPARSEVPPKPRTPRPTVHQLFNEPAKSDYETAVTSAVKVVVYEEGLKQFCWKWFPSHGRKISDAYTKWDEKNGPVVKDIKDHALKLWESRAGEHKLVAAYVYPNLRKEADRLLQREFDASQVKEFEGICEGLPKDILSPQWNLERKLKSELALIRSEKRVIDPIFS